MVFISDATWREYSVNALVGLASVLLSIYHAQLHFATLYWTRYHKSLPYPRLNEHQFLVQTILFIPLIIIFPTNDTIYPVILLQFAISESLGLNLWKIMSPRPKPMIPIIYQVLMNSYFVLFYFSYLSYYRKWRALASTACTFFQIWYDLILRVLLTPKYVTTWSQTNMAVFGIDQIYQQCK